ncbi:unnamed protein product [Caenorhabditis angaria]|uniref:Uncharacterized protein n=1 Tax=Caenorhabditis angaria TaxID=860376 RepID=A0A9P1INQ5_9PELO|nr:unnamed protein product [Caenorhabditis angaria]
MLAYLFVALMFVAQFSKFAQSSQDFQIDGTWPNEGIQDFSEDHELIRALRSSLDKPAKGRYFPYYKGLGRK